MRHVRIHNAMQCNAMQCTVYSDAFVLSQACSQLFAYIINEPFGGSSTTDVVLTRPRGLELNSVKFDVG